MILGFRFWSRCLVLHCSYSSWVRNFPRPFDQDNISVFPSHFLEKYHWISDSELSVFLCRLLIGGNEKKIPGSSFCFQGKWVGEQWSESRNLPSIYVNTLLASIVFKNKLILFWWFQYVKYSFIHAIIKLPGFTASLFSKSGAFILGFLRHRLYHAVIYCH